MQNSKQIFHKQYSQSTSDNSNKNQFCYLFIKQLPQSILSFMLLIIGSALLCLACYQYYKARKINIISKVVEGIYLTIFGWGICKIYIGKIIVSEIIFFTFQSQTNIQLFETPSQYVFAIDVLSVYAIQTILLLISYNWMSKMVQIFHRDSAECFENQYNITKSKDRTSHIKFEKRGLTVLKIYLLARLLFLLIIIAFVVLPQTEYINFTITTTFVKIIMISLLFQAALVTISLFASYIAVKKNNRLHDLIDGDQIRKMIKRYKILLICAGIRLIIDTILSYLLFLEIENIKTCQFDVQSIDTGIWRIFVIIIQGILTHYLPIFVTLKIFKIQANTIKENKSFLISSENVSDILPTYK